MALLTLVRHGQSSFLSENYDRLSPLGERQSAMLGEYWAAVGTRFDQVYHGPAERHIRTGEIAADAYRKAGLPWPEPIPLPEFDEYQAIEAMRAFLPGLIERHEDIREMEASFRAASDPETARKTYDRLFQRVIGMWVAEEVDSPSVEPFRKFCGRVDAGLSRIRTAASSGGRIAVFTSGGVIAATAGVALDLSPQKTLELSWAPRNASFSDFRFSRRRFSLSTFNDLAHLTDARLITYR